MPDEPHFPAPGEKTREPYREPERAPALEEARKVVTRAEPPSSTPERAALTREEVRALIAVTAAQRPPWRTAVRRSPILFVAGVASHFSLALGAVLFVFSLVWIARPLFRKDGFS